MKTKAAVLHAVDQPMEIVELDLDGPRDGEVLVRYTHSGICHSDVHVTTGDLPARLPMVLGHEGAGVVEAVGPGVTRVRPGDHFVCSFNPCCGTCHWCATGRQPLCDMGATILEGYLPGDRWPLTGPAGTYGAMCVIEKDIPLEKAALVGCGVPTGWGSAVNAADVRPGETVVVYGSGGIGINAVQGARFAGARNLVVVDPVAFKREQAMEFGATHTAATAAEAQQLVSELTKGIGADKAIVTVGRVEDKVVSEAFDVISKAGTLVITGMTDMSATTIALPSAILTLYRKTVRGTLFGDCNPTTEIPRLLDLYRTGDLQLDPLVTRTYPLDQINQGYDDLLNGELVRGVVVHQH
jgi:alcohol dehydrogenase (nicotinoprotein)